MNGCGVKCRTILDLWHISHMPGIIRDRTRLHNSCNYACFIVIFTLQTFKQRNWYCDVYFYWGFPEYKLWHVTSCWIYTRCCSYSFLPFTTIPSVCRMKSYLPETLERYVHSEVQYFLRVVYGGQVSCECYILCVCAWQATLLPWEIKVEYMMVRMTVCVTWKVACQKIQEPCS